MRTSKSFTVFAASTLCIVGFANSPSQADSVAPACKDIPSCGVAGVVIGTEIIGGVLYYLVRNASGVVNRVRSSTTTPAHRVNQGETYPDFEIGHVITTTRIVRNKSECQAIANEFAKEHGGTWEAVELKSAGVSIPEVERGGQTQSEPGYRCKIKRVK